MSKLPLQVNCAFILTKSINGCLTCNSPSDQSQFKRCMKLTNEQIAGYWRSTYLQWWWQSVFVQVAKRDLLLRAALSCVCAGQKDLQLVYVRWHNSSWNRIVVCCTTEMSEWKIAAICTILWSHLGKTIQKLSLAPKVLRALATNVCLKKACRMQLEKILGTSSIVSLIFSKLRTPTMSIYMPRHLLLYVCLSLILAA